MLMQEFNFVNRPRAPIFITSSSTKFATILPYLTKIGAGQAARGLAQAAKLKLAIRHSL